MPKKKENRGGKRKGSGRKRLEPTKTVSFRVRVQYVDSIKQIVNEWLKMHKLMDKNKLNSQMKEKSIPQTVCFEV